MWTFKCYHDSNGKDVIDEWYQSQDASVRAEMDAVIEYLLNKPRDEWKRPKFDLLKDNKSGKCKGLSEIRFKVNNIQYRVLGFFGSERLVYVLVDVGKKTDENFYKSACKNGHVKRKEIQENGRRAKECFSC